MNDGKDSKIGLLGFGSYTPDRVMTNREWSELIDTSNEWIIARTGIEERRIADASQSTLDLALEAARAALDDAGLGAEEIDEIVVATDTPEVYIPDTASYLQHHLGAGEIPAYDLAGSGCAGYLLALDIARSRCRGTSRRVLVVGVELLTRLMNWEDRNTCVLFGDAAGAAVVGTSDDAIEILASAAGTDGSKADILSLEAGGTRVPFSLDAARRGLHKKIVMKGREVFRQAVHRMSQVSREVLDQAGVSLEEVALVVPHQANLRILRAVTRALELPEDKLFINVQKFGNTGSASVPLALDQARQQGRIATGDLVLLTSFGAGFHWAALLLRF